MNLTSLLPQIDLAAFIVGLVGVAITLYIAYQQAKQLHLLYDNLDQLRKDREKRDRIEKYFRFGKSRKYTLVYPSYFHGKPVDTVWAGDFFALMTLNNALSAITPEKTVELKPVSPHEKYGKGSIPNGDLIFVCSPRANSMLNAVFPTPRVHSAEDKDHVLSNGVSESLPCWFVEDYTYDDLSIQAIKPYNTVKTRLTTTEGSTAAKVADASDLTVGDAVNSDSVPRGTIIAALVDTAISLAPPPNVPFSIQEADTETIFIKPILELWDLKGPTHDSLVSPAETAYLHARRAHKERKKTFVPEPKNQRDYGILLRTQRADGRYTFVLAGIHQYGTFIAARYLQDLFDGNKDRDSSDANRKLERHVLAEDDFLVVIEGVFSHEHFHVTQTPYPARGGAWIWTRSSGGEWQRNS